MLKWLILEKTMKVSFVNKLSEKKDTLVIVSDKNSMSKIVGLSKNIINSINFQFSGNEYTFTI